MFNTCDSVGNMKNTFSIIVLFLKLESKQEKLDFDNKYVCSSVNVSNLLKC